MKGIEQLAPNRYRLITKGHTMTLERRGADWVMKTMNASVRAYGYGFPSERYFSSLQDVEAAYKSWYGILKLHFAPAREREIVIAEESKGDL